MLNHAVFCLFALLCSLVGCADAGAHISDRPCSITAAPISGSTAIVEPEPVIAPVVAEPEPPPVVKIGRDMAGKTVTMMVSGFTSTEEQTDSRPCEAADQSDICERKLKGELLCAASREFPLGTRLKIAGLGTCTVIDYKHARYTNSADWYFGKDTDLKKKPLWHKARKVGYHERTVKIVSIP